MIQLFGTIRSSNFFLFFFLAKSLIQAQPNGKIQDTRKYAYVQIFVHLTKLPFPKLPQNINPFFNYFFCCVNFIFNYITLHEPIQQLRQKYCVNECRSIQRLMNRGQSEIMCTVKCQDCIADLIQVRKFTLLIFYHLESL